MKAFAQFIDVKNTKGVRMNTILQFGSSWDTIGAAWLINPGSSSPSKEAISQEDAIMLCKIDDRNTWSVASIDSTMRFLEKVINGNSIQESRKLNGIIRLFNLYNLREPNLEKAIETISRNPNIPGLISIEQDVACVEGVNNIYLGWGNVGKTVGREYAEKVFSLLTPAQKAYCDPDFMKNRFYHPMFVNRGIRFRTTKEWLKNYFESSK